MKIKKLISGATLLIVVAFIAFLFWPHGEPGSSSLAEMGISIPASAVTDYEEGPFMLKSREFMVAFRLAPAQLPALMKQIETKERHEIGLYSLHAPPQTVDLPHIAKFFAAVPRTATSASFLVIHRKGEKTEWATDCFFAIDKSTGRVWFCGSESY